MTALEQIVATAREHGWTVAMPENRWEPYELTRRNPADRRRTEYIRVLFDVNERVTTAVWGPRQDGMGGRSFDTLKRQRILAQLGAQGHLIRKEEVTS